MDMMRVGQVNIGMDQARRWVRSYTATTHANSKKPYAYLAYDFLETGSDPRSLNDGDLLAPVLVNAAPSVSAFYRLRAMAPALSAALGPSDEPLGTLTDPEIKRTVWSLYDVLDQDLRTHPRHGVSGTTLSKVLHRKRPMTLCLHDKWVLACYVGAEAPVPRARARSWADYMTLISQAMAADLRSQSEQFEALRNEIQGAPPSDLRILDILAWSSRGVSKEKSS